MIDKALTEKLAELKARRTPFESTWEELARYFCPYRENLFYDRTPESPIGKYLFDSTGVSAVRMLAEGLFGYLMSPSLDWFKLEVPDMDTDAETKYWLEGIVKDLYAAFRRSNFYSEVVEFLIDGITFGTGVLYFEENLGDRSIFYKVMSPPRIWIDEDGYGQIKTVFRQDTYTEAQATDKFGCKNLGGKFIHAVVPDGDRWRSVWYHEMKGEIVRESKYDFFPYIVWRCIKNPDSVYGYSPAMMSLPTVKTLNSIRKSLLEAGQLSVKPPMNVPINADVDLTPNGINYFDSPENKISPVNLGINFPIGRDREEQIQKSVRDFFSIDFFLMFAHQERAMTATEVVERQGEKAAILGNIVGRLTNELLDKVIEGAFNIEFNAGRLEPPPEGLAGKKVDIEYLGPLAVAQKRLFESRGLNQAIESVAPILQANPDTAINLNWDYLLRYAYNVAGAPAHGLIDEEEVQKKRILAIMQQQAQAQAEAEAAGAAAVQQPQQ